MQGDFERSDVVSVETRVTVQGVNRTHVALDWGGSRSGSSPVGAGVYRVSGSVSFQRRQAVMVRQESPATRRAGWPPRRGDQLRIWHDVTLTNGRVVSLCKFTGRVDTVTMGDTVEATFVQDWDRYRSNVTVDPMMRVMPGVTTGESTAAERYQARIEPIGPVYQALEQIGYGILPPVNASGSTIFHASWQAATIPTIGGVHLMGNTHVTNQMLWYLDDVNLLQPYGETAGGGSSSLGVWIRSTHQVWDNHSTAPSVTLTAGSTVVVVQVLRTAVSVTRNGSLVASVPYDHGGTDPVGVAVLWNSGNVHVYSTGSGEETSVPVSTGPPSLTGMRARARWTAALRVTRGETLADWRATAQQVQHRPVRFYRPYWGGGLDGSRLIEAQTVEDVLEQYSEHQVTSTWIDETGNLQIWGLDALHTQTPVRTYTEGDILSEVVWDESWQHARSSVVVDYMRAAVTNSGIGTTILWQGSSAKRISNQESDETIIEPPSEEDWVDPDFTFSRAQYNIPGFNSGQGSWWAAVQEGEDRETVWVNEGITFTAEQIARSKVLVRHELDGLPAGSAQLSTPTSGTDISRAWLDKPMPVVRGRGRITWSEVSTVPATGGPSWAPQYVHEMGWWGRPQDANRLRNWLNPRLTNPLASLEPFTLRADPQLARGDVITIDLTATHGFEVTVLVEGLDHTSTHSEETLTVTPRVLSWTSQGVTYAQFRDAAGNTTYDQFEALRGADTYDDFKNTPLEGL